MRSCSYYSKSTSLARLCDNNQRRRRRRQQQRRRRWRRRQRRYKLTSRLENHVVQLREGHKSSSDFFADTNILCDLLSHIQSALAIKFEWLLFIEFFFESNSMHIFFYVEKPQEKYQNILCRQKIKTTKAYT